MALDSLGLGCIEDALAEALEAAGFAAKEEFTDFDSRAEEGCIAVWAVSSIGIEDAGRCLGSGAKAVRAELGFKIRLMGRVGEFGDRAGFNERCCDACARLAGVRGFGDVSVKLGGMAADMRQKRLVREMGAVFKVYMKEVP